MEYEIYQEIALTKNLSKTRFKKGDIATIIEIQERDGKKFYTLEFFSSLGDSLGTHEVEENFIMPLLPNSIVSMRIL